MRKMLNKGRRIFMTLCTIFLLLPAVSAHDPGQISYIFQTDAERATLTVHFTPKGAMDLLLQQRPALHNEPILYLENHLDVYTDYFNKQIHLAYQGRGLRFQLIEGDLLSHDAHLTFVVEDFPGSFEGMSLQVDSFTELYRRLSNLVVVEFPSGRRSWQLNSGQRSCVLSENMATAANSDQFNPEIHPRYALFMALGGLILLGICIGLGAITWLMDRMNSYPKIFQRNSKATVRTQRL
ncbi:MAG: hypothetical protein AAGA10_23035 [Bacteroidota bacterium]